MSQEYYMIPKDKVSFGKMKSDITKGLVDGVTLYDNGDSNVVGEFYIDDHKGNILAVYKLDGITFAEYNQLYNNAQDILAKLMKYYGFNVLVEGQEGLGEITANDLATSADVLSNQPPMAIPLEFMNIFRSGSWRKSKKGKWGTERILKARNYRTSLSTTNPSVAKSASKKNRKKGYASHVVAGEEPDRSGKIYIVYRRPESGQAKQHSEFFGDKGEFRKI